MEIVEESVDLLTAAMTGVSASLNRPNINNESWRQLLVDVYLATFKKVYDDLRVSRSTILYAERAQHIGARRETLQPSRNPD